MSEGIGIVPTQSRDPWRYELPCEHQTFTRNVTIERGQPEAYKCQTCGEYHPHLIDKKTGRPKTT